MAYSDFTMERLTANFGVDFEGGKLFLQLPPIEPSAWLVETIDLATESGYGTEKSRSERLVSPILLELAKRNHHQFSVVSGSNLDVDPALGLNGECDFVLTRSHLKNFIKAPVFCITEAKKQDTDHGIIQCAAQLIGASRLNAREKKDIPTLFGCATTGVEWRFLRFENQLFTLDEGRYLINDLPPLLGALQHIIDRTKPLN